MKTSVIQLQILQLLGCASATYYNLIHGTSTLCSVANSLVGGSLLKTSSPMSAFNYEEVTGRIVDFNNKILCAESSSEIGASWLVFVDCATIKANKATWVPATFDVVGDASGQPHFQSRDSRKWFSCGARGVGLCSGTTPKSDGLKAEDCVQKEVFGRSLPVAVVASPIALQTKIQVQVSSLVGQTITKPALSVPTPVLRPADILESLIHELNSGISKLRTIEGSKIASHISGQNLLASVVAPTPSLIPVNVPTIATRVSGQILLASVVAPPSSLFPVKITTVVSRISGQNLLASVGAPTPSFIPIKLPTSSKKIESVVSTHYSKSNSKTAFIVSAFGSSITTHNSLVFAGTVESQKSVTTTQTAPRFTQNLLASVATSTNPVGSVAIPTKSAGINFTSGLKTTSTKVVEKTAQSLLTAVPSISSATMIQASSAMETRTTTLLSSHSEGVATVVRVINVPTTDKSAMATLTSSSSTPIPQTRVVTTEFGSSVTATYQQWFNTTQLGSPVIQTSPATSSSIITSLLTASASVTYKVELATAQTGKTTGYTSSPLISASNAQLVVVTSTILNSVSSSPILKQFTDTTLSSTTIATISRSASNVSSAVAYQTSSISTQSNSTSMATITYSNKVTMATFSSWAGRGYGLSLLTLLIAISL